MDSDRLKFLSACKNVGDSAQEFLSRGIRFVITLTGISWGMTSFCGVLLRIVIRRRKRFWIVFIMRVYTKGCDLLARNKIIDNHLITSFSHQVFSRFGKAASCLGMRVGGLGGGKPEGRTKDQNRATSFMFNNLGVNLLGIA